MKFDMADVKPSVVSWLLVTIMAATGIIFLKWSLNRWQVPGLTEFVNAI